MQPDDFDDFPTVGVTPFDVWLTHVMFIMVFNKKIHTYELWCQTLDKNYWKYFFDQGMSAEDAVEEDLSYWRDEC